MNNDVRKELIQIYTIELNSRKNDYAFKDFLKQEIERLLHNAPILDKNGIPLLVKREKMKRYCDYFTLQTKVNVRKQFHKMLAYYYFNNDIILLPNTKEHLDGMCKNLYKKIGKSIELINKRKEKQREYYNSLNINKLANPAN